MADIFSSLSIDSLIAETIRGDPAKRDLAKKKRISSGFPTARVP